MAAEKKYHVGKRMIIFRNIFYGAATFVLIVFYFIYDYVFAGKITWLKGAPLQAIFIFLEVVVIFLAKKYVDRVIDQTEYRLTSSALEVRMGTNHMTYRYRDFTRAYYGSVDFTGACPVTYEVSGKTYRPSQYLDNVWEMHQELVKKIRPYAEIEEGLESKISAFVR